MRGVLLCLVACGVAAFGCSSQESSGGGGGALGVAGSDAGAEDASDAAEAAAPFTVPAFDKVRIGSDSSKPNFQKASVDIDWGPGPFEKVTLVADLATTCYPFETWKDNPPPAGHNWPADCDAFDRNYEFRLDPPSGPADPPSLELVRAITPFGGPLHTEIDVTDVANGLPGKHELMVGISTWSDASGKVSGSDGGWFVSAHFVVTPGTPPRNVIGVQSLFDGNVTSANPMTPLGFEVPPGVVSTRLEYRATGHGGVMGASGCGIQPAEEFCLRTHALFADQVVETDFMPWRDDCADLCTLAHQGPDAGGFDYCQENPCGAIQSVKASRANWCPGSVTPPLELSPAQWSTPGSHSFHWQISDVADGGSWRISATLFLFGT